MKVLIIGGTSGIGAALAGQLSENGHEVISVSRTAPQNPLPGIEYIEADVLTTDISVPWDEMDGLVYAPGSINLKPFGRLKKEDFITDFEINVWGAAKVLQQFHDPLKKANGSVVLFSTVAVSQGMPYHASVAASKGALEGLTRSLAAEWSPQVRVNVIAPSVTDTPMASRLVGTPERKEASAHRHPLQRIGEPGDIASVAKMLLESPWITGQVIGVDGGMSTLRK